MAVAGVKPWYVRAVLGVTALALIATSPPPSYVDEYRHSVVGPVVELTDAQPDARFTIVVRATGLGARGAPTTDDALAEVSGVLASSTEGAFVHVRLASGSQAALERNVLTDFRLTQRLAFEGDCRGLAPADPCEAKLELELTRSSSAEVGAVTRVDWRLDFEGRVHKDKGPDAGPFELPWEVEVTRW